MTHFEDRSWRAEVGREYIPRPTGNLAVHIWRRGGDGAVEWVLPCDLTIQTLRGDELAVQHGPSMSLDDDMAIALLNALAAHFGGTSDVQRLHRDLQAERARVDKFIAHLTA